jgi:hypothetical protein
MVVPSYIPTFHSELHSQLPLAHACNHKVEIVLHVPRNSKGRTMSVDISILRQGSGDNLLTLIFKPDQSDLKMLRIFVSYWIADYVGKWMPLWTHTLWWETNPNPTTLLSETSRQKQIEVYRRKGAIPSNIKSITIIHVNLNICIFWRWQCEKLRKIARRSSVTLYDNTGHLLAGMIITPDCQPRDQ